MITYCGNCGCSFTHTYGTAPDPEFYQEVIEQSILCANWHSANLPDCSEIETIEEIRQALAECLPIQAYNPLLRMIAHPLL